MSILVKNLVRSRNQFWQLNEVRCVRKVYLVLSSDELKGQFRWMSQGRPPPAPSAEWDEEANAELERQSKVRENRYRWFKKIFSTALFGSTLGIVWWARQRKQAELSENLRGCVRLPIDEDYGGGYNEFYRVPSPRTGKSSCVLLADVVKKGTLTRLKEFKVLPSDVFVASFPKSGTTWVQEIVYLIKNDLDFQKASEKVIENRFPYLEYLYPGIESIQKMESPRLIKTHLPLDLLPPGTTKTSKVIYIRRNPKDVVASYWHFARMITMSSYRGSFEDFLNKFIKDQVPYSPYFEHLESYMENQDDPNLLIISYEELSHDPAEVIRRIGIFLERPLSEDEVQALVRHTKFEAMASNSSVNYVWWDDIGIRNKKEAKFFRKGQVGDWKNYFTQDSNEKFDAWIRERNKGGRKFTYDLCEAS